MACKCKNGSTRQDFLTPVPGGTAADATYLLGLTHFNCGNTKILVDENDFPVIANLNIQSVGTPVFVGNADNQAYCAPVKIGGTVTYRPACGCRTESDIISETVYVPCSSTTVPTVTLGTVQASPVPTEYYSGCCRRVYPLSNTIALTTSLNVTTA